MSYIQKICYIYIYILYIYHTHTQQKTQQTTHTLTPLYNHHSTPMTQKMDIWTSKWTPSWVVRQDPPPTAPRSPGISTRLEVGRKPYPTDLYTGKTIHPGRFRKRLEPEQFLSVGLEIWFRWFSCSTGWFSGSSRSCFRESSIGFMGLAYLATI